MDFGGILAGAMAGGGKAIQQNAQSQLEKQRKQALIELEQNRADKRAAATAQAEAAQAAIDRQAELDQIEAEGAEDRKTAEAKNNITSSTEAYNNAYDQAQKMTDSAFRGITDIASGPTASLIENVDQIPEYNSIFARNLRVKASAIDDPDVSDRLIRQADALESMKSQSGGGNNDPLGIR